MNTMQTALIRLYDDVSCRRLRIEAPISRAAAMEEILAGLRATVEIKVNPRALSDDTWMDSRDLQWAGYDLYRTAAPLGKQHLTRVQLRPAFGTHRYEYVFPGGLSTVECDDICPYVIGGDNGDNVQNREWLVTSTLAGVLHGDGVSLADHVVAFACGKTFSVGKLVIGPASPPTKLCTTVRGRGWSATVEWLRDTDALLENCLDTIQEDRAVWVPVSAPKLPWEPLILQYRGHQGCLRLALGAEAAAYAGRRVELAVSDAERADWLTDGEAQAMAMMSQGEWRRWIETHREVRIGRRFGRDGRLARNRRLVHKGDLRRALRLARPEGEGSGCMGLECPQRCLQARYCPHRNHHCPG
jgi:hypothetical protein